MSSRLPAWWRPAWFWAAVVGALLVALTAASVLRGPAHPSHESAGPPTVPRAWEGLAVSRLTTILSVAGPESTTVRLVAAEIGGSGPCLGVVVSAPSINRDEGPNGNAVCDSSVAAVLADPAVVSGVSIGAVWEWQSRATGKVWFGCFGTTTLGSSVHLDVGDVTQPSTPVTRHAYLTTSTERLPYSPTCVLQVLVDAVGTTVEESPVAGACAMAEDAALVSVASEPGTARAVVGPRGGRR